MCGSEVSQEAAQDIANRAFQPHADTRADETAKERDALTSFREVLYHCICTRKKYPEARENLNRPKASLGDQYKQELCLTHFCLGTATPGQSAVFVNRATKGQMSKM